MFYYTPKIINRRIIKGLFFLLCDENVLTYLRIVIYVNYAKLEILWLEQISNSFSTFLSENYDAVYSLVETVHIYFDNKILCLLSKTRRSVKLSIWDLWCHCLKWWKWWIGHQTKFKCWLFAKECFLFNVNKTRQEQIMMRWPHQPKGTIKTIKVKLPLMNKPLRHEHKVLLFGSKVMRLKTLNSDRI